MNGEEQQYKELEEAGRKALEKMSAEHQFVWEKSRLKTLSEVEKVIEGMKKKVNPDWRWKAHHTDTGYNAALAFIQSAIQEMKQ